MEAGTGAVPRSTTASYVEGVLELSDVVLVEESTRIRWCNTHQRQQLFCPIDGSHNGDADVVEYIMVDPAHLFGGDEGVSE